MLHLVCDERDHRAVDAQFDKLLDTVTGPLPAVAAHLDTVRADVEASPVSQPTVASDLVEQPPTSGSTTEIRRRTDLVGIFPASDSVTHLIGAGLAERNHEWVEGPLSVLRRPHPRPDQTGDHHDAATGAQPTPRRSVTVTPVSRRRSLTMQSERRLALPCTAPAPTPASGTNSANPHPARRHRRWRPHLPVNRSPGTWPGSDRAFRCLRVLRTATSLTTCHMKTRRRPNRSAAPICICILIWAMDGLVRRKWSDRQLIAN